MQLSRHIVWLHVGIVALILLALVPAQSARAAQAEVNSYDSGLGYTITWSDEWSYDETFSIRSEGVLDLITLWNSSSDFLMISGVVGTADPASLLVPGEGDAVISSELEGEVPRLVTESDGFRSIAEGYALSDAGVAITVSLTATVANYDATLAQVQGDVTINSSPVLTGQPLAGTDSVTDLTGANDPTAEVTSEVTRTQRGGAETPTATEETTTRTTRTTRTAAETPTATDEATTTGVTRTTRTTAETPTATEETTSATVTRTTRTAGETPTPTEETPQVVTGDLETFVGPVFGYTLNYDTELWEVRDEHAGDGVDGISMTSPTSTLTILGWNGYGSDPLACLDGEAEYYANEVENISDWAPVLDADGNPLRGEGDDIAWGVYSLTYQNEAGDQTSLIDYISCQPIPGQDAMLIVLLSSVPETYNDNLDLTFNILDTVQFGDAPVPAQPTAATEPTTAAVEPTSEPTAVPADTRTELDTNFDGSLYTSPGYGFTVYVPLEWSIVAETAEGAEERLVLNNGTSELTLWSTNAAVGDLSGCVDYAANNSGKPLSLLKNSTGGDFRGDNGEEAFGHFVYDANGVQMMYFIGCRPIPGTDGVLIVIQDVEFSQFTNERRFRTDIEESITMP